MLCTSSECSDKKHFMFAEVNSLPTIDRLFRHLRDIASPPLMEIYGHEYFVKTIKNTGDGWQLFSKSAGGKSVLMSSLRPIAPSHYVWSMGFFIHGLSQKD